ncbi:hypothetical protein KIPB_007837 [Kipferlia bialata]|uniref:Uncharacterized protein n=1 Tax=Kipferlia bialata TaxID=797122 RepID=A0A9K3CZ66_9EUKA|nr:hypothetical protein KIPB_007837 [Kipferlia bialata]|eukprot:g7837.t1
MQRLPHHFGEPESGIPVWYERYIVNPPDLASVSLSCSGSTSSEDDLLRLYTGTCTNDGSVTDTSLLSTSSVTIDIDETVDVTASNSNCLLVTYVTEDTGSAPSTLPSCTYTATNIYGESGDDDEEPGQGGIDPALMVIGAILVCVLLGVCLCICSASDREEMGRGKEEAGSAPVEGPIVGAPRQALPSALTMDTLDTMTPQRLQMQLHVQQMQMQPQWHGIAGGMGGMLAPVSQLGGQPHKSNATQFQIPGGV